MGGIVRFPSGGSNKGIYCWERYKILDDSTKEFDTFVVSSNENKYPNGDVQGEYYYQRNYAENETVYLLTTTDSDDTAYAQLASQEPVTLTATETDVRMGALAVTENGIIEGTKDIPPYHTKQGTVIFLPNEEIKLQFYTEIHDYTGFQATIAKFNTEAKNSVDVEMVVINGSVYRVGSTDVISTVRKDTENKIIDLGIVNGDSKCILRYILFKEEW